MFFYISDCNLETFVVYLMGMNLAKPAAKVEKSEWGKKDDRAAHANVGTR